LDNVDRRHVLARRAHSGRDQSHTIASGGGWARMDRLSGLS